MGGLRNKKRLLLFVGLGLGASLTSAGMVVSPQNQIIAELGKPLQVKVSDGRLATVYVSQLDPILFPVPIEIAENTCTDRVGDICELGASVNRVQFELRWDYHPDPKKIGQVVEATTGANPRFEHNLILYSHHRRFFPKIASKMLNDELTCTDYRWLPGGSASSPPSEVRVARWDDEYMLANPETEQNENRILGGAVGVVFNKTEKGNLQLVSLKEYTGFYPVLFAGNILGWVVEKPQSDSGFCQISLKPDLLGATGKAGEHFAALEPPFKPYLFGTDEALEHFLKMARFINDPQSVQLQ